jgi:hypothetical protein
VEVLIVKIVMEVAAMMDLTVREMMTRIKKRKKEERKARKRREIKRIE